VLTIWLNITNTTTQVELDIFNSTTNTLSSSGTTGIGEAPQLSSTYAQYDDGASVFNNYWNFAGTTMPSGWSTESGLTVNNGLTFSNVGFHDIYTTSSFATPIVIEGYGEATSTYTYQIVNFGASSTPSGANFQFMGIGTTTPSYRYNIGSAGGTSGSPSLNTFYVFTNYITNG
ncbi:MAG: hypothetical protein ACP5MB_11795, partial [bacterium]